MIKSKESTPKFDQFTVTLEKPQCTLLGEKQALVPLKTASKKSPLFAKFTCTCPPVQEYESCLQYHLFALIDGHALLTVPAFERNTKPFTVTTSLLP